MRIEIILDDGILNSGQPIQVRVKRYLEYTVFHVLIYYKELRKYEQRTIYVKLPCKFLDAYSHRPFALDKQFELYQLEPELTYKFVNFEKQHEKSVPVESKEDDDEEVNVDTLNNTNGLNETANETAKDGERLKSRLDRIPPVLANLVDKGSNDSSSASKSTITNLEIKNSTLAKLTTADNTSAGQNKFAEQVLPIRGTYKLQTIVYPGLFIEMTDNAETPDGLVSNLVKMVDDENEFLKPLNLIYLANLNNFDAYFGLNKTFNTSTSLLTKNIETITTNVLQKNKTTTNYVPLLSLLNNTISKINLTNSLNSSLQDSLKNSLKISLAMQNGGQNDSAQDGGQKAVQDQSSGNWSVKAESQGGTKAKPEKTKLEKSKPLGQLAGAKVSQLAQNVSLPGQSNQTSSSERTNSTGSFNHTQIYIGNVDNNNTLSTLPPFVGCISGVIFNNQLINLTKITEKRYGDQLRAGHLLAGCKMLCSIKNCQNSGQW